MQVQRFEKFLETALSATKPNYTQIQLKMATMHLDHEQSTENDKAYADAIRKVLRHMENAFGLEPLD